MNLQYIHKLYVKFRYLMKCESQNSIQELDINKLVHLAMEKCFVGEMVYVAFLITNSHENKSQMQTNILPTSKAKDIQGSSQLVELLANGIYRVENEGKQLSIANAFAEYLSHYKECVTLNNWEITDNIMNDDYLNQESKVSFHEKDRDITSNAVSPRNLLGVNSNGNKFLLSMSSHCQSKDSDSSFQGLSRHLENSQRSLSSEHNKIEGNTTTVSEKAVINIISKENFMLSDLQQSFCSTSNTSNPRICTSIKEERTNCDSPKTANCSKGLSEKENIKPLCLSTTDLFSKSDIKVKYLVKTKEADNVCLSEQDKGTALSEILTNSSDVDDINNEYDMLFDSPTSEDLDAFFNTDINFTWLSTKLERTDGNKNHILGDSVDPTSTSFSNVINSDEAKTCLTSTPSQKDHSCHKITGLDGDVSPIYYEFKSTPEINHDDVKKNNIAYDVMFPSAMKRQSKLELQTTPCSFISRKKTRLKEKHESKSMLRYVLNPHKSSKCLNHSLLENMVHVSQRRQDGSSISFGTPLLQDTTPLGKCKENSLPPIESERDFDGSNKKVIKSRGKFQNLSLGCLMPCSESDIDVPNSSHNNRMFLTTNVGNEKPSSPFTSPLLFSP